MKRKIILVVVMILIFANCFSTFAFAKEPESQAHMAVAGYYNLATHYGYFQVPYGTLVGYGYDISGYNVHATQASLKHIYDDFGINCNPGVIDCQFGPNTKTAIENFQASTGLSPDGIAGDLTFAKFVLFL